VLSLHCAPFMTLVIGLFFVQLFFLCVGNGDLSFSCSARFSTTCICIARLQSFAHTCFSFVWLFILHHAFYITHCTIFKSHLLFFALPFFIILCSSSYFLFLVLIFYVFDVCKFFFVVSLVFFCNYLSTCLYFPCPYFRAYFFFSLAFGDFHEFLAPTSTLHLFLHHNFYC
jgi:hypothetical protein